MTQPTGILVPALVPAPQVYLLTPSPGDRTFRMQLAERKRELARRAQQQRRGQFATAGAARRAERIAAGAEYPAEDAPQIMSPPGSTWRRMELHGDHSSPARGTQRMIPGQAASPAQATTQSAAAAERSPVAGSNTTPRSPNTGRRATTPRAGGSPAVSSVRGYTTPRSAAASPGGNVKTPTTRAAIPSSVYERLSNCGQHRAVRRGIQAYNDMHRDEAER